MQRLLAVSYRVHTEQEGQGANRGGLAIALAADLRERHGIWFGWSGGQTEEFISQITFSSGDGEANAIVDLKAQNVDRYYNGFANRTLRPLFHYWLDLT